MPRLPEFKHLYRNHHIDSTRWDDFTPRDDDIEEFWRGWCTRGSFPFETDGYPFWSHLSVTQSWWDYRDLSNILVLHYADMKADTADAVARVAEFLGLSRTQAQIAAVAEAVSFDAMKGKGETYAPNGGLAWKGGADTFMNKGTNRRWEGLFSAEDLALYDQACDRALSPECRDWLAKGGWVQAPIWSNWTPRGAAPSGSESAR